MDDTEELRRSGLRVTAPRRAVLEAVRQLPHADADAVLATVRASLPSV